MFLSARAIESQIEAGRIGIRPFSREFLKTASYVLRLGKRFAFWDGEEKPIHVWHAESARDRLVWKDISDSLILDSRCFVLAATMEAISLPDDHAAVVLTLSHLARFGVTIHSGSQWISPLFGNRVPTAITLELQSSNPSPIVLKPGVPVGHIIFAKIDSPVRESLQLAQSVYEGLQAPAAPRLFEEFESLLKENA